VINPFISEYSLRLSHLGPNVPDIVARSNKLREIYISKDFYKQIDSSFAFAGCWSIPQPLSSRRVCLVDVEKRGSSTTSVAIGDIWGRKARNDDEKRGPSTTSVATGEASNVSTGQGARGDKHGPRLCNGSLHFPSSDGSLCHLLKDSRCRVVLILASSMTRNLYI